jgi:uncharacterized protein
VPDITTSLLVSIAVFAGAFVSGLSGFAFSAVAGAILLRVFQPLEAVPLMMACSIVTQTISLVALRSRMQWRGSTLLIAGGALGIFPAVHLLHQVNATVIRIGFGAFLVFYAGIMLLRPAAVARPGLPGRLGHAIVGFAGGLVGGLTAMPGALPTLWCDLRGLPKDQQRGLVQPYITAMQVIALALLVAHNSLSKQALWHVTLSLPALAAGAALGVLLFQRLSDASFRTVVLMALMVAGLLLVV